jgi:hypothetical protein
MEFKKISLSELLKKADQSELVLPNFQREYVWKIEQQKLLIASFLVDLPIGTFLILDGQKNQFISKPLCFKKEADPLQNCLFLLDGQQRLSTIKSVFSDILNFHDWENNYDQLYYLLRNKWSLDLKEDTCKECFGFNELNFKKDIDLGNGIIKVPIISTKEPSDILDAIKVTQIFKTKKDTKYHPGRTFNTSSTSDFDKKIELATLFATDSEIPLFDLLSQDKTIIKNTLKFISNSRVEILKNEVLIDKVNDYAKSCIYLKHLDNNIQNKYINGNWTEINSIWESLKEDWVNDIIEYFKDIFKSELMVPNIKENELSRATSVFEFMNKGGTPLDSFDIMVAKFAQVGAQNTLYDKLEDIVSTEFEIPSSVSEDPTTKQYKCENFGVFSNTTTISKQIKEIFLNFLSLNTVNDINEIDLSNIKKDKILGLKTSQIDAALNDAEKALKRSLAFLQFRCGIHNYNLLSYNLMLLPIGMILKNDDVWNNRDKINKIEYWYWTSLFSGRYREKQNQRSIQDIKELYSWIVEGTPSVDIIGRKSKIFSETNYSDQKTLLMQNEDKSVPTAIYYGILQYTLSGKPNDFTQTTSQLVPWEISTNGIKLQDHHIIPLGSVTTINESSKKLRTDKNNILNSPLNRTFITQKSNQEIGSLSIDRYLPMLNIQIQHTQFIPNSPNYNNITSNKSLQEEFIKGRFDHINRAILIELDRLVV